MKQGKLALERASGRQNRKKGILSLFLLVAGLSVVPATVLPARLSSAQADSQIRPEDVGWSSARLEEAARCAGEIGYSALVLAHDRRVFFTWGKIEHNYRLHSVRKPLLGALYGLYVERGTIDLDTTLEKLGIDDIPPRLTPTEKQATIRHLLQGRSGVYHVAAAEEASMIAARPERGSHAPGEFFYYNNWDFNALGTIFEKLTGKRIFEEFKTRIAVPIGMQDFDPARCEYNYEKEKSEHPQYSFRMSARDLARFGILYQQKGIWAGKQVLPAEWIASSTTSYSDAGAAAGAGFGYLWGIMPEGSALARLVGGAGYFFTGMGVQVLIVIPEQKLVQVLLMDTDGSFHQPKPEENVRLYGLIAGARERS
jgi:CubicO group peptidase (beta-lactamase class C family)